MCHTPGKVPRTPNNCRHDNSLVCESVQAAECGGLGGRGPGVLCNDNLTSVICGGQFGNLQYVQMGPVPRERVCARLV